MRSLAPLDAAPPPPYSRTAKCKHTVSVNIQLYIISIIPKFTFLIPRRKNTMWKFGRFNNLHLQYLWVVILAQFAVVEPDFSFFQFYKLLWKIVRKADKIQ
jgi:hypothetical protein